VGQKVSGMKRIRSEEGTGEVEVGGDGEWKLN
jgi:hypothetical protein